jgi:carboxypeptidase Q
MIPKTKLIAGTCLAVLMSVGSFATSAQQLNTEQQAQLNHLKKTALQSNLSYQLIESLTTEVGHRMMGSIGDKKSIVWAVNKMKALGFDKVWTEEVTGSYWLRGEAKARIVAPYPHDVVVLKQV